MALSRYALSVRWLVSRVVLGTLGIINYLTILATKNYVASFKRERFRYAFAVRRLLGCLSPAWPRLRGASVRYSDVPKSLDVL